MELLRDGDVEDAQGVLDASGVTVPTGDMVDGCYDEQGALYQMPAWVVAEPEKVVEDDSKGHLEGEGLLRDDEVEGVDNGEGDREKGKEVEGVTVKARLSDRGGPDVVLTVGKDERVGRLVRRIQEEANVSNLVRVEVFARRHVLTRRWNNSYQVKEGSRSHIWVTCSRKGSPCKLKVGGKETSSMRWCSHECMSI